MSPNHSEHSHNSCIKNIKIAFALNIVFTVIEIIGGVLTNSVAIISDALHDLGDSISLGLSWYLAKLSLTKRTKNFTYGYKRFSLLAAAINSFVLLVGSFFIITKAVPRLINPEQANAPGMLLLAVLGITVNGIAVYRLKNSKTLNEKVVGWHLLEDVLGWVAILIVSTIMMIKNIPILDPILSIFITLYILWNVIKNLKKTVMIFLQSVPESLDIEVIEAKILENKNIISIHDTHVWSLDGEHNILSMHLVIDKNFSQQKINCIKCEVRAMMKNMGINHTTIEIDAEGEACDLKLC